MSTTQASPAGKQARPADTIRVYNTLSKVKEPFVPLTPGKVGVYLCGPTVYKPSHIGHMVGPVIFDTIKRYLVYSGFQVTLVINVTDVDDKLIAESNARGITMAELAREMTADYMANLKAMGVRSVDHFPHATEHIDDIIRFTQDLIDKGFAYPASGDVYFDVLKDREYGKLSHRSLESMQGEGGGMADRKRSNMDFALWKGAKPGEPSWPSPWGPGRPGWHIECSAMSRTILGKSFDIHGGGLDLVFPHHENEVAQSECCHGQPQAKYWLHNGLMQAASEVGKVGGRNTRTADEVDADAQEAGKMGKSKGASAFRDLLKAFAAETIRFFLLSTHYRRPIYYSQERLHEIETSLDTFYRFFKRYQRVTGEDFYALPAVTRRWEGDIDPAGDDTLTAVAQERGKFIESMDDDFNTGGAVGNLFELVRVLNKYIDAEKLEASGPPAAKVAVLRTGAKAVRELAAILGLFESPPAVRHGADDALVGQLLSLLIDLRNAARKAKNFGVADQIRNGLAAAGVQLEDRQNATEWSFEQPQELPDKLMRLVIDIRAAARSAKDFATADKIRDGLATANVVLEDRPDGTEWSVKA